MNTLRRGTHAIRMPGHHGPLSAGAGPVSALATTPDNAEAAYVFAHGAGAGMAHPFMERIALGLAERRVACLRFQFPYMEAGKRRVDAPGTAHETVRAAVAQARELWPGLPLFAGGKSLGGRMTSQAQAIERLEGVLGLVFLGFPLHLAGKPSVQRAEHLSSVDVPMLFVRGTRDALAEAGPFGELEKMLGSGATYANVAEADHSFQVLRRSGRGDEEVCEEVVDWMAVWMQAFKVEPA